MLTLFGWTREKFVYAAFGLVSGGAMKVQNEKTTGGPDKKTGQFKSILSGEATSEHGFSSNLPFYGIFSSFRILTLDKMDT